MNVPRALELSDPRDPLFYQAIVSEPFAALAKSGHATNEVMAQSLCITLSLF
jgi:hypothetical protein